MATQSIIAAVKAKYESLTGALFPGGSVWPLYFDSVPQTDASGVQVRPPYARLRDSGQEVRVLGFNRNTNEVVTFEFELYAVSLADVDTAVLAVKRNNGTSAQGLGFDWGTLSDLASPRGTFAVRRMREQRGFSALNITGARVHYARLTYRVEVLEQA